MFGGASLLSNGIQNAGPTLEGGENGIHRSSYLPINPRISAQMDRSFVDHHRYIHSLPDLSQLFNLVSCLYSLFMW